MCTVVVSKLCQWQQGCPVVLVIIDGTMQMLLQNLVNPFCLSIFLQMKCQKKLDFYLQDREQRLPKLEDKLRSSINKKLHRIFTNDCLLAWNKMGHL